MRAMDGECLYKGDLDCKGRNGILAVFKLIGQEWFDCVYCE